MTYTPERIINRDFIKKLESLRDVKKEHTVSCILEPTEYARHVGYIQALNDIQIVYTELWEAHYGKNS